MSQLFEDGKVISIDGVELECVSVSYQETDGEKHTFGYTFRPKSEVDAEREAAAKAEEERLALEASAPEVATPEPLPTSEPETVKEETLNVK